MLLNSNVILTDAERRSIWLSLLFNNTPCLPKLFYYIINLSYTHRRLILSCATTMRVRFVYGRRRYATIVKMRNGLATLNSNNSVVYGQKHKVWVLVFLVRTSGTF